MVKSTRVQVAINIDYYLLDHYNLKSLLQLIDTQFIAIFKSGCSNKCASIFNTHN